MNRHATSRSRATEPWLSEMSELSDTVGRMSDTCRTTVGLSDCRAVGSVSDQCRSMSDCRTLPSDRQGAYTVSDTVGSVGNVGSVGMSDCRTSVGTVRLCRRAVGPATTRLLLSHSDSCIVHHTTLTQHSTYAPLRQRCKMLSPYRCCRQVAGLRR